MYHFKVFTFDHDRSEHHSSSKRRQAPPSRHAKIKATNCHYEHQTQTRWNTSIYQNNETVWTEGNDMKHTHKSRQGERLIGQIFS
jgi:hypothetical protein